MKKVARQEKDKTDHKENNVSLVIPRVQAEKDRDLEYNSVHYVQRFCSLSDHRLV
jgi:hypothetical protein